MNFNFHSDIEIRSVIEKHTKHNCFTNFKRQKRYYPYSVSSYPRVVRSVHDAEKRQRELLLLHVITVHIKLN